MFIHLGAKTCIANCKDMIKNICPAKQYQDLCPIAGTFATIDIFGQSTINFGSMAATLENVAFIPHHLHSTIDGGASLIFMG